MFAVRPQRQIQDRANLCSFCICDLAHAENDDGFVSPGVSPTKPIFDQLSNKVSLCAGGITQSHALSATHSKELLPPFDSCPRCLHGVQHRASAPSHAHPRAIACAINFHSEYLVNCTTSCSRRLSYKASASQIRPIRHFRLLLEAELEIIPCPGSFLRHNCFLARSVNIVRRSLQDTHAVLIINGAVRLCDCVAPVSRALYLPRRPAMSVSSCVVSDVAARCTASRCIQEVWHEPFGERF